MSDFVQVSELVEQLNLTQISGSERSLANKINSSEVSRPGLELTGYLDYFSNDRVLIFGRKELSFIEKMTKDVKLSSLELIFSKLPPVIVISHNLTCIAEIITVAQKFDLPVLLSQVRTSRLIGIITSFLADRLSPRTSVHGVLMNIYGVGILLQGDSGIGKSETALELIKRGHLLVADDRVDVYQEDERTIMGEAPPILNHLLEIRGLGIIDVMDLFGAGAVQNNMQIELLIYLEQWDIDKQYDRLGSGTIAVEIAKVNVPQIRIPVKTGRNLSIIIEAAAMNFRAKKMGFDASEKFSSKLDELIRDNTKADQNHDHEN